MTKSRRLKHFFANYSVIIRTAPRPDLEEKISQSIDEHVRIEHKYLLKNHTIQGDVKRIEKKVDTVDGGQGEFLVGVSLHIHHYTGIYFDLHGWIATLNKVLGLPPGSVFTQSAVAPKQEPQKKKVSFQTPKASKSSAFI